MYDILSEEQGELGRAGCRISSVTHTHAGTERGRKENVLCLLIYTPPPCPFLKHQGQKPARGSGTSIPEETPCEHPRETANPAAPLGTRPAPRPTAGHPPPRPQKPRTPRATPAGRTSHGHGTPQRGHAPTPQNGRSAPRRALQTGAARLPNPAGPVIPVGTGRSALPRSSPGGWSAAASGNPRGRWLPRPGPLRRRLLPSSRSAPRRSEPSRADPSRARPAPAARLPARPPRSSRVGSSAAPRAGSGRNHPPGGGGGGRCVQRRRDAPRPPSEPHLRPGDAAVDTVDSQCHHAAAGGTRLWPRSPRCPWTPCHRQGHRATAGDSTVRPGDLATARVTVIIPRITRLRPRSPRCFWG